jgi:hypothetical protein
VGETFMQNADRQSLRGLPQVLFILLVLTGGAVLSAQSRSFDLDVPNGKYNVWRIDDIGPVKGVQTTLEIYELRHGSQWSQRSRWWSKVRRWGRGFGGRAREESRLRRN